MKEQKSAAAVTNTTAKEVTEKQPATTASTSQVAFRYSDSELEEFRILITERLEVSRKELQSLQNQIRGKNDNGEEDVADRHLSIEDGSASWGLEQMGQLAARQIQFITNLENALLRIRNKTYGICRQTGKLIDKARLRAVPHATLSMEAKTGGK